MPDLLPIQESFAYGVITPRLWNRPSTDRFEQAVAWCRNMLPISHGPAALRRGSRYISKIDETNHDVMLVPFQYTAVDSGVLVIGENYAQVYDRSGPVTHTPANIELIVNGTFDVGVSSWIEGSGHNSSGMTWNSTYLAMEIESGGNQGNRWAYGAQNVQIETTTGVAHDLVWDAGALDDGNVTDGIYGNVRVGTTLNGTEIAEVNLQNGTDQTLTFTPGAGVTNVYVTFYVANNGSTMLVDNVSMKEQQAGGPILARWASPYANYTRQLIQYEALPNADTVWLAHPNVQPHALSFDGKTFTFAPITFTGAPGAWSSENWPAAITFHQQRSWWGGAPGAPETLNASKVGDYADLTTGTQADQGLQYTLARRGRISWMKGARTLIVGTETAEYIAESSGTALIPGDIEFRQQSAYGSIVGQVENIGDRVVYASGDETKLRTMAYEWTKDAWVSIDLAWPAENLPVNRIERLAYATEPESMVLMTEKTAPYRLLVCSYNREQSIIGWSDHLTEGEYHGIAVTSWAGSSVTWVAVIRDLNGTAQMSLEQFGSPEPYFLDSWEHVITVAPTTTFSGLDHLEGKTVKVEITDLGISSVHPPVTVSGGSITLQYPAQSVVVGLPYTGVMLTLPIASQNQALVNVASRRKRWNKIYMRLASSVKPLAAAVNFFDAYQRLLAGEDPVQCLCQVAGVRVSNRAERYPQTPMNVGQPALHEDVQVGGRGWSTAHGVLIVQDVPLETIIVGMFGEMGVGTTDSGE